MTFSTPLVVLAMSAAASPSSRLTSPSRYTDRQIEEGEGPFGGVPGSRRQLGVELMPLSDQLAAYFGVKTGVLVTRVRGDSPAASAGIKAGDVITTVNGASVTDVGDVAREERRGTGELALTLAEPTLVEDVEEASFEQLGILDGPSPVRFSDSRVTLADRPGLGFRFRDVV